MTTEQQYLLEAADRIMIQDMLGRYAFACDYELGNPAAWSALFTEDGRFEVPAMGVVAAGHEELERLIDGTHKTAPGIHHVMTNFVIDIDGDTARGKCELNEFLLRPEAIHSNLQGWYEDEYVKRENQWYIAVRRVHLTEDAGAVAMSGKIGEHFGDFLAMLGNFKKEG